MDIKTYRIYTGMGRVSNGRCLPFLTEKEVREFNNVGYTGKDFNGDRITYEGYLNTLNKGTFKVNTIRRDNAEFTATYDIVRVVEVEGESELDLLRKDLKHQLDTPDELDWNYFLETAQKAKLVADKEDRNMWHT